MAEKMTFEKFQSEVAQCVIGFQTNLLNPDAIITFSREAVKALCDSMTGPQELRPMKDAPRDGTRILLKTNRGWVEAWFCYAEPTDDAEDDGYYDWVCLDDSAPALENDAGTEGWLPLPEVKS